MKAIWDIEAHLVAPGEVPPENFAPISTAVKTVPTSKSEMTAKNVVIGMMKMRMTTLMLMNMVISQACFT